MNLGVHSVVNAITTYVMHNYSDTLYETRHYLKVGDQLRADTTMFSSMSSSVALTKGGVVDGAAGQDG